MTRYEAALELLRELLGDRLPPVFSADPRAVKPLAIGTHLELQALVAPARHGRLARALGLYCASQPYLRALQRHDSQRHALDGTPAAAATHAERFHAVEQLAAQRRAAPRPKPRPVSGRPTLSLKRKRTHDEAQATPRRLRRQALP
jgi:sRNA-binding protein